MGKNWDRFMEFIVADVTDTAPADIGVASVPIQMPVSENENLAVLIHKVNFLLNAILTADLAAAASGINRQAGLCTFPPASHADMLIGVDGCLAMQIIWWTQSANGDMTGEEGHGKWNFDPPILVARRQLYLGAQRSAGIGSATNARVQIGYTVEKVSRDAFVAALVGPRYG